MKHYLSILWMGLLFVVLSVSQAFAQSNYYDKHIIIAIDQTPDVQTHYKMPQIKDWLLKILLNQAIPADEVSSGNLSIRSLNFNPETDCIELFAFGVEGCGKYGYDDRNEYYKVKYNYQNNLSNIDLYNKVSKTLLSQKVTFHPKEKLSRYLQSEVTPLLSAQDIKYQRIDDISGLTLSYYVYPFILNRIDTRIPAREYYLIVITNFKSGSVDGVNSADVKRFEEWITNGEKRKFINTQNDNLEDKYKKVAIAKYVPKVQESDMNLPIIVINKLLSIESVQSNVAAADIESNISISQRSLRGNKYSISPISLRYENSDVEQVDARICVNYDLETEQIFTYTEKDWQHKNKSFIFEGFDLQLDDLQENDTVSFSYVIFPKNTSLLPSVDIASQYHVMQKSDFVPEPTSTATIIGIIVLVLLLFVVGYLLLRWSGYRGRKRKVKVDFRFLPVSNERYMDVSDMQVKEYDCWYMTTDVMNRTQTRIEIRGKMTPETLFFARSVYQYRLEFRVHDVDVDSNFTFRPQGQDQHGAEYELKKWYNAPCDANGNFSVSIIAYLDPDRHPNGRELTDDFWEQDHILKTQIDFRVLAVEKHNIELLNIPYFETNPFKEIPLANSQKVYEFIARPHFNLRDSWVAFDPGTSGACAAFITGGNIDNQDNIHLVKEQVEYSGDLVYESIFPSKIHVQDTARAFKQNSEEVQDVSQWEEGTDGASRKDFLFGWPAAQLISRNNFQSIKKLLGYTSLQLIVSGTTERQISGKKLAQLLVKGLYEHTKRYIMAMYRDERIIRQSTGANFVPQDIEDHYIENGEFNPKKAIVAVPNNYTLPKIQDMVDTVKALGQFREVHYLYESEGVLMQYFHKMWGELPQLCNRMFIVYDMGGATINATAFRISNSHMDSHQNLTDIEVETIGKIGYCVGGDDIDYAIMRQLFLLKDVKAAFGSEDAIKKNMAAHKQLLIKVARELKLELVAIYQGKSNRVQYLQSAESFTNSLQSYAKALGWPETLIVSEKEFQLWTNLDRLCGTSMFKRYIYAKVEDATNELFNSMSASYRNMPIELIFSGRSTLFPHIVTTVEDAMIGKLYNIWDGLMTDGYLDATLVKTAVAEGACWYAYFSRHIRIKHDIITSAFGYVDYDGGKELFVPLIQPGERFKNGRIEASCEPLSPALLREVQFMQMLGSNYDQILIDFRKSKGDNKHKLNIIDKIRLNSDVSRIAISIDERSNFEYAITAAGEVENISQDNYPQSRLRNGSTVRTEIADENNESYLFAAISSTEEIREEQMNIKLAPNSVKQQRKHI